MRKRGLFRISWRHVYQAIKWELVRLLWSNEACLSSRFGFAVSQRQSLISMTVNNWIRDDIISVQETVWQTQTRLLGFHSLKATQTTILSCLNSLKIRDNFLINCQNLRLGFCRYGSIQPLRVLATLMWMWMRTAANSATSSVLDAGCRQGVWVTRLGGHGWLRWAADVTNIQTSQAARKKLRQVEMVQVDIAGNSRRWQKQTQQQQS